jgi:hypothetical protein
VLAALKGPIVLVCPGVKLPVEKQFGADEQVWLPPPGCWTTLRGWKLSRLPVAVWFSAPTLSNRIESPTAMLAGLGAKAHEDDPVQEGFGVPPPSSPCTPWMLTVRVAAWTIPGLISTIPPTSPVAAMRARAFKRITVHLLLHRTFKGTRGAVGPPWL